MGRANLNRRKPKMKMWMASVVVVGPDNKIPLVMDTMKPSPHFWKFPGGHSQPGETEGDTARREVLEETGLEIEELEYLAHEYRDGHTAYLLAARVDSFDQLKERGNE